MPAGHQKALLNSDDLVELAIVRAMARSGVARRIRLDAVLSLAEVAAAVGVAQTTIFKWEVGDRAPRGAAALAYKRLLDDLAKRTRPRAGVCA